VLPSILIFTDDYSPLISHEINFFVFNENKLVEMKKKLLKKCKIIKKAILVSSGKKNSPAPLDLRRDAKLPLLAIGTTLCERVNERERES